VNIELGEKSARNQRAASILASIANRNRKLGGESIAFVDGHSHARENAHVAH
jgi:hypothetical protein